VWHVQVPIFEYMYHICDDDSDSGIKSLSDVCLLLDYRTYTPGSVIIGDDSRHPCDADPATARASELPTSAPRS
jgi:hypothetical protein